MGVVEISNYWEVENNDYLVLVSQDGSKHYLTAQEIYSVEFKDKKEVHNLEVSKPSTDLEKVNFSKVPIDIKLFLEPIEENGEIRINIRIVEEQNKVEIPIKDIDSYNRSHVIIDNVWRPFVKGALREIKSILEKASINNIGKITIKEYMELLKLDSPLVIDNIDNIPQKNFYKSPDKNISNPLFNGQLYPYQKQGVKWLNMIVKDEAGCILADEMGLGKTAQVIAVLTSEYQMNKSPSLVVYNGPINLDTK
ncbi:SNF2-related protein [Pontibacillus sp. HMF3514]|uniref:SNF2-related protein n=1 Tax=Pontibacillus sp. HMF3514 TaxID=2692425 RepID=UPI00131FBC46|nr:DEAD/DEAH box helicase [Pontibacillus sp. HMF3514]QHE51675.1 hypothetical protein GS400_06325 [Pontibacillus sp. HMF3514]